MPGATGAIHPPSRATTPPPSSQRAEFVRQPLAVAQQVRPGIGSVRAVGEHRITVAAIRAPRVGPRALLLGGAQCRRARGDAESPGQLPQWQRGPPTGQQLADEHPRQSVVHRPIRGAAL